MTIALESTRMNTATTRPPTTTTATMPSPRRPNASRVASLPPATCPASATSSPPRRCAGALPQGRTRRSTSRTACTPSSCRAPRSPRRAARTGAAGCTGSARRRCTARSRRYRQPHLHNDFDDRPGHAGPAALGSVADAGADGTPPVDFVDGLFTMAGNGSPAAQHGVGIHVYAANRSMDGRFFYDADGELLIVPQQGRLHIATELGVLDVEPQEIAVIPRGVRFRVELPDGPARGLRLRELRRAAAPARPRPDRQQRPGQPARFPHAERGLRGRRRRVRTDRQVPGPPVARRHRPLAARRGRLARQLRAVQVRPAPLQHDRLDQLRPSRSVDLHRADLAQRHAGHGQPRLRDLPAALAGGAGHVPAAVVPPQRRQRVHGPGARRLRRQGRGLRARRRVAAQLHERPRPGRGDVREGERRRPVAARHRRATPWPSCSRRAR